MTSFFARHCTYVQLSNFKYFNKDTLIQLTFLSISEKIMPLLLTAVLDLMLINIKGVPGISKFSCLLNMILDDQNGNNK